MIANIKELEVACRNLKAMQRALEILHSEIEATNPELFNITSTAYVRKIQALRCEIAEYLGTHPEAVSLLLNPDFALVPLTATQRDGTGISRPSPFGRYTLISCGGRSVTAIDPVTMIELTSTRREVKMTCSFEGDLGIEICFGNLSSVDWERIWASKFALVTSLLSIGKGKAHVCLDSVGS